MNVTEVYSVTGDFDIVAVLRLVAHKQLAEVASGSLARIEGLGELTLCWRFVSIQRRTRWRHRTRERHSRVL
ncbi:MAG: Lrp/AsnC ligand binding domain-containing protein [Roseiflexus sp.]|nr:Lrp/AsnC ligand binding domain-containing protein [Roseiflexus sp.]